MNLHSLRLDKTSHLGEPEFNDLVPSRYALRVGQIDVMVISGGVLPLPAATLATNADPAALAAWLEERLLPPDVFTWALNVAVVRSGDRTILIDAGIGGEYPELPAGRLALRLDAAGIDPASVTDVVLTHLHIDHVGGLLADGLMDRLRPEVPIHLAAAEVEFWKAPDFSRTAMPAPMPDMIRLTASRFLDAYRSQLRPFEEEYEVAPGVVVARTGGHTPGHSVVRLASGGDRLTFLGDAVFPDHFDRPDWYNAFDHDPRRRFASGWVSCENWRPPATRRWPRTCRSRPSAGWQSTAMSFVGRRPIGSTNRLLAGWRTWPPPCPVSKKAAHQKFINDMSALRALQNWNIYP